MLKSFYNQVSNHFKNHFANESTTYDILSRMSKHIKNVIVHQEQFHQNVCTCMFYVRVSDLQEGGL